MKSMRNHNKSSSWTLLVALVFLGLSLILFGRNLDFYLYAHPDEPNKVAQIINNEYNFHHPMLMIRTTSIISEIYGKVTDFKFVMLAGRWTSITYASLAVFLFVLINGRIHGSLVAVATGIFLISNPHLFDLAHYFKEDPCLLFGIALVLFAMLLYSEIPGAIQAGFVGLSCALAFSAKYSAGIVLPFSIYILIVYSKKKPRDFAVAALCFITGIISINYPAFEALAKASGSLNREIDSLTGQSKILTRSIPHGVYSNIYWQSTTPVLIGLLVAYALQVMKRRFAIAPIERVMIFLPLLYVGVLSFLPKTHHRYFLPVAALLACLSAVGLKNILKLRHGFVVGAALILLSVAWQLPRLFKANRGFTDDYRKELAVYLEKEISKEAKILQDKRVDLKNTGFSNLHDRPIQSSETLESLRKEGFTHIIVTSKNYGRVFLKSSKPTKGSEEEFELMKLFYMRLFQEGSLIREWDIGDNLYLAPPFRVYSIQSGS
jgi:4-amino-4-deoxy-L-arabinose transferase-like glycosyltransferase